MKRTMHMIVAALLGTAAVAQAALPPPSPAQAQAAAEKKAAAEAQAQKDKQALLATIDKVAARWRAHAAAAGIKVNPPVPVPAPSVALSAPTRGNAPAAQPGGQLGPATHPPERTEKAGTAPPSADVKKQPSRPMPPERRR